jgi:SecD/SecF fusion protein
MLSLKQCVLGIGFVALLSCAANARAASPENTSANKSDRCVLVYKVDEKKTDWKPEKMDSLVAALRRRLNPSGAKDIEVNTRGTNMVEIKMPFPSGGTPKERQARAEEIHKRICTTGVLEFRIVANVRNNKSLIDSARAARQAAWTKSPGTDEGRLVHGKDSKAGKPIELGKWCRVSEKEAKHLASDALVLSDGKDHGGEEKSHLELLVLAPESESRDVTDKDIRRAWTSASLDGGWEIDFRFSAAGGKKFGGLTGEHLPADDGFKYKLAIVLDDRVVSAPSLVSQISDSGRISGDFNKREAEELAQLINDGALPAVLDPTPVSETIEKPDSSGAPPAANTDGQPRGSK